MESPSNGDMPPDIIFEILLRLPVKTLLKFKCTCKLWYSLIKSSSFINEHFIHKSNKENLLVRHYNRDKERYAFALFVDETKYEEPDHLQIPRVSEFMGPLNGIFFCASRSSGHMALVNLSLRQLKPLPLNPEFGPSASSTHDTLFGFGLDPLSGDYKVVLIPHFWNDEINPPHDPGIISIYTSGVDSWRHFEDVDLVNLCRYAFTSHTNTYLNGFYYWITDNDDDTGVLAFDMSSEKYLEVQVPDCIKTKQADLTLCGDSLALMTGDYDDWPDNCADFWVMISVDVWLMKKDGSWSKWFTVVVPSHGIRFPICFWKDELLLERDDGHLILYNVRTQKLRTVAAQAKEYNFFTSWLFCYKESLFSLGDGDKSKLWDTSYDFVKMFLN